MDEYVLPELVLLKEVEVPVQTIIVNNEVREITQPSFCICCPECGRVLYSFPPNTTYSDAYKAVVKAKTEIQEAFPYCTQCGIKLSFDYDIIDADDYTLEDIHE